MRLPSSANCLELFGFYNVVIGVAYRAWRLGCGQLRAIDHRSAKRKAKLFGEVLGWSHLKSH